MQAHKVYELILDDEDQDIFDYVLRTLERHQFPLAAKDLREILNKIDSGYSLTSSEVEDMRIWIKAYGDDSPRAVYMERSMWHLIR